jgi:hypothetical protein
MSPGLGFHFEAKAEVVGEAINVTPFGLSIESVTQSIRRKTSNAQKAFPLILTQILHNLCFSISVFLEKIMQFNLIVTTSNIVHLPCVSENQGIDQLDKVTRDLSK